MDRKGRGAMNIIVFSKDRPALLDLFLRSMIRYFADINKNITCILLKETTHDYSRGYAEIESHSKYYKENRFLFAGEEIFKHDVLSLINEKKEHTVFFTDDDIFCNEFSLDNENFKHFKERDDITCSSLRLNKNLTYCYPQSKNIIAPEFAPFNVFRWKGQQGYYNYPMSVNGHIFKTKDILPLLEKLEYDNPTWLEYQLSINPIDKPFMNCNDKSIIVNNPCNRVQAICENRNENIDNKWMNEQFLSGKRLSLDMVKNIEVKSCHQPIELIWE